MTPQLVLPDKRDSQKASAVKGIAIATLVTAGIGEISVIIAWLFNPRYPLIPLTLVVASVSLISLVTWWLVRANKARAAGYLFTISFLAVVALITTLFGGFTGPMAIIYLFPILVAGTLIDIRASFFIATLAAILYLAMIPIEKAGLFPQLAPPQATEMVIPYLAVSINLIFFCFAAFLSWFAASRLHQTLQESRRYATELQAANEKLQASEEKLRTSNEELEATNEELQTSEEELRTSNEEMEASNQELREAQEQLIRSEKLAAIGKLAGGVGHELRNPLGAIKNAVYYVKGKVGASELGQQEPRLIEFLDIIDDEINSSNKIINDLLNFSRVGKPSASPTQIKKVIENALSRTPLPENIRLTKSLNSSLPEIEIDADQIQQVLVNIIANAAQAMPDGGRLSISAEEKEKSLEVEITDTGGGIAEDVMAKIFDPLFTTRAKGIGLGLAVCKSIIDRHEGHIEVKSKSGKGTTFRINLPLKAA